MEWKGKQSRQRTSRMERWMSKMLWGDRKANRGEFSTGWDVSSSSVSCQASASWQLLLTDSGLVLAASLGGWDYIS